MAIRTVFCVQCYAGEATRLVKGRLWQFGAEQDALGACDMLEGRVAGFVAFRVRGEPDFDQWEEPEVLRTFGATPRLEAAA